MRQQVIQSFDVSGDDIHALFEGMAHGGSVGYGGTSYAPGPGYAPGGYGVGWGLQGVGDVGGYALGGYQLGGYQLGQAPMLQVLPRFGLPATQPMPMSPAGYKPPVVGGFGPAAFSMEPPNQCRGRLLPLNSSAAVGAGLSAVVSARPQQFFRAEKISIDPALAANFTIEQINVGNLPQLLQTGSLPASMFASNAPETRLAFDLAQPAQDFSMSVTNQSGAALFFRAGIAGTTVQ